MHLKLLRNGWTWAKVKSRDVRFLAGADIRILSSISVLCLEKFWLVKKRMFARFYWPPDVQKICGAH